MLEGVPKIDDMLDGLRTSSFEASLPNEAQEIQLILVWEHNSNFKENNTNRGSIDVLSWPRIFFSPVNEYNTRGLFDIVFPSLFPKGEVH